MRTPQARGHGRRVQYAFRLFFVSYFPLFASSLETLLFFSSGIDIAILLLLLFFTFIVFTPTPPPSIYSFCTFKQLLIFQISCVEAILQNTTHPDASEADLCASSRDPIVLSNVQTCLLSRCSPADTLGPSSPSSILAFCANEPQTSSAAYPASANGRCALAGRHCWRSLPSKHRRWGVWRCGCLGGGSRPSAGRWMTT